MYELVNAYLENGLEINLHKIPGVKTISCGLWVRQGSSYETDSDNGLSHLTEHLLLNPETVNQPSYTELMGKAVSGGVIYNAATTKEYTCFYYTGLSKMLYICISALAHIATNGSSFSKEKFENEKKVVLQEATGFYSSFQQIKERTSQALWGNRGTGRIIMGDMKNISGASQEQIAVLAGKAYQPKNAVLAVIGNIDYDETLRMIEEKFQKWENSGEDISEDAVESESGIYVNQGSGANTVFSVGFRAPAYNAENRVAAEMLVRILGQSGLQSRMAKEIRMKRGLSYTLGGFSSFYGMRGTMGFMAVCDKQKTLETAKVLMDVLREMKEKGVTEEEVQREKQMMETALLLSVDNITEHLRQIGRCSTMNHNFYIERELLAIQRLGREEVNQAAGELLKNQTMGLAVIGECDIDKMLEIVDFGE